jgi:hypothetical protein
VKQDQTCPETPRHSGDIRAYVNATLRKIYRENDLVNSHFGLLVTLERLV